MNPEYTLLGLLRRPASVFELETAVRERAPVAGPGGLTPLRAALERLAERGWVRFDAEGPEGGRASRTEEGTRALLAWLREVPTPAACADPFAHRLAFLDALPAEEALSLALEERERLRLAADEQTAVLDGLERDAAGAGRSVPGDLDDDEWGHYAAARTTLAVLRARAAASDEALRLLRERRPGPG